MRAPGMRTVARGSLRVVSMLGVQSMAAPALAFVGAAGAATFWLAGGAVAASAAPTATPSPPCPPLEGEGSKASFSRRRRQRFTNIQLMPGSLNWLAMVG